MFTVLFKTNKYKKNIKAFIFFYIVIYLTTKEELKYIMIDIGLLNEIEIFNIYIYININLKRASNHNML